MHDQLIKAAQAGTVLDLTRKWMPARSRQRLRKVPARQIRDLLLERAGGPLHARGIRLVGARITGQLDLIDVRSAVPLALEGCRFDDPVVVQRAQLSSLSLSGSVLPALHAEQLRLSFSLVLAHVTVTGHGEAGAVRLLDAHVAGHLDVAGAELTNYGGPALVADRLKVGSIASLADLRATGHGEAGAVRLLGAHIAGHLDLTGAELTNRSGPALVAEGVQVGSIASLADLRATGHGEAGAVRLLGAHITSSLDLRGATLTNATGPALRADGLKVGSIASLADLRATGHGEAGAVRLLGAHIAGQLDLTGAELTNRGGPALAADRLKVSSSAVLAGLKATGHGEGGAVRLLDVHIAGQLDLIGAELTNHGGPALAADSLQVDTYASLAEVKATGHGAGGAVRLMDAHFTGGFDLIGATLTNQGGPTPTNDTGPALLADRLQVVGRASLADLRATGHGKASGVRLLGAHITGQLDLTGAELTNHGGPALYAEGLQSDSDTLLVDLRATGHGEGGVVRLLGAHITGALMVSGQVAAQGEDRVILDLRDARVGGALSLWSESAWQPVLDEGKPRPRLLLEGFTYRAQPVEPRFETWLRVLRECMPGHPPQPYRQLADVLRAAGDEERAKMVLIAQQNAFGKTCNQEQFLRRGSRVWHWISRVTVRYGYRSGRALWFLLVVMAVSCGLMLFADTHGWVVHPKARGGGRCGVVESLGFAVDRTMPLLGTIGAGRCELTNAGPAQWIFVASVGLQILSWAFLTLFIAGFTGIVRKPST
ncbi:hypothetical protein [Streptomyces sp. MN13]